MSNYSTDFFRKYIDIVDEAHQRQYKGDGSDAMISKDGKVIVIDAEQVEEYLADGWELAE